eukprot:gnl/MRDRNA2_/MRDRNA2_64612_c0_seq1.p1 gnl/MRDRNA2_/MRDRNA2_64612_c0~~gnl/MRDRNA2_/MRDRNA2_64612_c0_seq1.p1  ORF type:complete len:387 (-),score=59.44 gnl/MRDRNA2_/MRDRNA2_64612_c0_seq1:40-1200(-)
MTHGMRMTILLGLCAHVHVKGYHGSQNDVSLVNIVVSNLVYKLLNRALKIWHFRSTYVDNITLGKIAPHHRQLPRARSFVFASSHGASCNRPPLLGRCSQVLVPLSPCFSSRLPARDCMYGVPRSRAITYTQTEHRRRSFIFDERQSKLVSQPLGPPGTSEIQDEAETKIREIVETARAKASESAAEGKSEIKAADWKFLEKPLCWSIVVDAVSSGDLDRMGRGMYRRTKAQEESYNLYRKRLLEEWSTIGECLKTVIFGFSSETENGKLKSIPYSDGTHRVVWRRNEFPYFLEPGIEHHCIWSHPGKLLTVSRIQEVLQEDCPMDEFEYIWFINPPSMKSVPDVDHAHVLYRKMKGPMDATKMTSWVTTEGGLVRGVHLIDAALT